MDHELHHAVRHATVEAVEVTMDGSQAPVGPDVKLGLECLCCSCRWLPANGLSVSVVVMVLLYSVSVIRTRRRPTGNTIRGNGERRPEVAVVLAGRAQSPQSSLAMLLRLVSNRAVGHLADLRTGRLGAGLIRCRAGRLQHGQGDQ